MNKYKFGRTYKNIGADHFTGDVDLVGPDKKFVHGAIIQCYRPTAKEAKDLATNIAHLLNQAEKEKDPVSKSVNSKLRVHPEVAVRIGQWALSGDTGISSETMAAIAMGISRKNKWGSDQDAPHDPSDFGRCYRLVMLVPEIIDVFDVIAKQVPQFTGILEHWDELCDLYERDLPTGRCSELYSRMRELRMKAKK